MASPPRLPLHPPAPQGRASVVTVPSPTAAVERLSAQLHDHQVRVRDLVSAEDAVLARVYLLEQLLSELTRPRGPSPAGVGSSGSTWQAQSTATTTSSVHASLLTQPIEGKDLAGTYPSTHTTSDESGHTVLHTWLPFPCHDTADRMRDGPTTHAPCEWRPQRVQIDAGGLTAFNQALYRTVSDRVQGPQSSLARDPVAASLEQNRDPFLTPEGTQFICDDEDDGDQSVVSVPEHSQKMKPQEEAQEEGCGGDGDGAKAIPPSQDGADDVTREKADACSDDQDAPGSFANLVYAPPSMPLPTVGTSDCESDSAPDAETSEVEVNDDEEDVEEIRTTTTITAAAQPAPSASVTVITDPSRGTVVLPTSSSALGSSVEHVLDDDANQQTQHTGLSDDENPGQTVHDSGDDIADDEGVVVQSSPVPHVVPPCASRHTSRESVASQNSQVRARTTPSPVQRELDAFFPAPAKPTRAANKRGAEPPTPSTTHPALPQRTVHQINDDDVAEETARAPTFAADLLAMIPTISEIQSGRTTSKAVPIRDSNGDVHGDAATRAARGPKPAPTHRANGRKASAAGRMRRVPGLEADGVGHVRTKRRRDADYREEQRVAHDEAALREDTSASRATPPCTPSLYWDTTMPTPYRK